MAIAILPAAGRSRRMGQPKLLLPFGETTVLGALVGSLRQAGIERIVIVTAPDDHDLAAWALEQRLEHAVNPHPERGMLSTILAGIDELGGARALALYGEPLVISPADMPAIRPATIRRLLAELAAGSSSITVPMYAGHRGHPLCLSPQLTRRLAELDLTIGLKQLLEEEHDLLEVPIEDPGVRSDIDTPEEYENLGGRKLP